MARRIITVPTDPVMAVVHHLCKGRLPFTAEYVAEIAHSSVETARGCCNAAQADKWCEVITGATRNGMPLEQWKGVI